jgi:hypothetical protein
MNVEILNRNNTTISTNSSSSCFNSNSSALLTHLSQLCLCKSHTCHTFLGRWTDGNVDHGMRVAHSVEARQHHAPLTAGLVAIVKQRQRRTRRKCKRQQKIVNAKLSQSNLPPSQLARKARNAKTPQLTHYK